MLLLLLHQRCSIQLFYHLICFWTILSALSKFHILMVHTIVIITKLCRRRSIPTQTPFFFLFLYSLKYLWYPLDLITSPLQAQFCRQLHSNSNRYCCCKQKTSNFYFSTSNYYSLSLSSSTSCYCSFLIDSPYKFLSH